MQTNETTPAVAPEAPATQPQRVVLLGKEHDITAFASNDPSRYVINSVHYNEKAQCLEAVDGRVLIRVPVEVSEDFPTVSGTFAPARDVILPIAPFKKALASIPKSMSLPVLENVALSSVNGEKARFTTNDLDDENSIVTKAVEGNYPNTEQVIPTATPTFTIALSAELLQRIGAYFAKHGSSSDNVKREKCVVLEFTAGNEPVRFAGQLASGKRATGVLMPMRLS